jgi:hypothetical protein
MNIWDNPELLSGLTQTQIQPASVKPFLGLGIIHTGIVTFDWAMNFRYLNIPWNHVYFHGSNMPYDCSREMVVRNILKDHQVEYIFFLDTDVVLQRDGLVQLVQLAQQHNKPLVSGLYFAKKRDPTPMPCAWIKTGENLAEGRIEYRSFDIKPYLNQNALIEVDVAGAGCLLIKSDIFKKLDESNPNKPYFQWGLTRKDENTGKPLLQLSEDFYFMDRCARELNIKPHLSTAVKCDHYLMPVGKRRASDGELEL